MNIQLSDQPTWFQPTAKIRALTDKSILIIDGEERTPAILRVGSADPQGANVGKCSVKAQQAMIGNNPEWTNTGTGTPPPTEQINVWQKFLNEAAVDALCENDEDPEFGELILRLS